MVDAGAWLGALGTAAAFVATQEALLIAGPLILPLVALYASREKNSIDARESQARVERQFAKAVRQLVALSEEGTAEMAEEVASALQALEGKEGAGKEDIEAQQAVYTEKVLELAERLRGTIREGDEEVSLLVRRSTDAVGEGLKKLRGDIQSDLRSATAEEVAALARLDARIESLEAAVGGLDRSQSDGFRRLAASISSREGLEEEAIGEVVKAEVWRSLEPVRQLPQVLSGLNRALPGGVEGQEMLTEENIKKILSIELDNLKNSLVMEQQDVLDEMAQWTTKVDSGQWNQLGAKLEELDEKLDGLISSRAESNGEIGENGEGAGDTTNGTIQENVMLEEMRDEVRSVSKELEAIGAALMSLSTESEVGSSTSFSSSSLPHQEALRKELMAAFQSLHERQGQYESSEQFARELSDVVVEVLLRVLGQRPGYASDEDPASGVPIASWIDASRTKQIETVGVTGKPAAEDKPMDPDTSSTASLPQEEMPLDQSTATEMKDTNLKGTNTDIGADADADIENDNKEGSDDSSTSIKSSAASASPYEQGLQALKDGRAAFAAEEYIDAEALLAQADNFFAQAIEADPQDIRSVGNRGNTLMVRAKTRLMMSTSKIESGTDFDSAQEDEARAQEMLLQAGRLYRQILELDPTQGKAFVNWGRVICLRAEISQSAEDFDGAYALFVNASDKFIAAMDALPASSAVAEAARLAAAALVGAYSCARSLGLQDDALELLYEAEDVLLQNDEEGSAINLEIQQLLADQGQG